MRLILWLLAFLASGILLAMVASWLADRSLARFSDGFIAAAPDDLPAIDTGLVLGAAPALVTISVPEQQRSRALGLFQFGVALGFVAGPPVGGLLLEVTSWRAVFLVRAPLAAAMLVLRQVAPRDSALPLVAGVVHRVVVRHHGERHRDVEVAGLAEDAHRRCARVERRLRCLLDDRTVHHGVAERDADLERIRGDYPHAIWRGPHGERRVSVDAAGKAAHSIVRLKARLSHLATPWAKNVEHQRRWREKKGWT